MTAIRIYWRETPDGNSESSWTDVEAWHWTNDGALWFRTPTGAEHFVNREATQLIIIQEK